MSKLIAPQTIFFDVDGVLIDSMGVKGRAFVGAFSDFPERHTEILDFHLAHGGVTRGKKIELIFRLINGRNPTFDELETRVALFTSFVVDAVIAAPEIQGASEALANWAAQIPLHAVSATPSEELVHILEQREMTHFFSSVHGWPPEKTETMQGLIDERGYEPELCVLVGDSKEDFAAAKKTGIHFVQVSRTPLTDFVEPGSIIRDLDGLSPAIASVLHRSLH